MKAENFAYIFLLIAALNVGFYFNNKSNNSDVENNIKFNTKIIEKETEIIKLESDFINSLIDSVQLKNNDIEKLNNINKELDSLKFILDEYLYDK